MRPVKRPISMYRFELLDLIIKSLEQNGCIESYIRGNSMEPTAYDGDTISIRSLSSYDELKKGMIVVFLSADNRHFVVHRIREIDMSIKMIYEQGDNRSEGNYVPFDRIKGIVCKINDVEV